MRRDRGQLALGLAAAFTMVLAIFGLVLRSGLVTREKMQLQQTSDFAALRASRLQWKALNVIRELNQEIERSFWETQALLEATPSPCWRFVVPVIKVNSCELIAAKVAALRLMKIDTKGEGDDVAESGVSTDLCQEACGSFDRAWRSLVIGAYKIQRTKLSAVITEVLARTNSYAYEGEALDTFANPRNLPIGLQIALERKYGSDLTQETVADLLARGELKGTYDLIDANKDLALFAPADEMRSFHFQMTSYSESGIDPCSCAMRSRPSFRPAVVKVYKASDYNTSFITGATYTPTGKDPLDRFTLEVRSMEKERFGKRLTDLTGKNVRLFQTRRPMTALSLAKPYGGTFPEPTLGDAPVATSSGKEFKGVKLVGLADTEEIGVELPLGGQIGRVDAEGRILESAEFFLQDYLH